MEFAYGQYKYTGEGLAPSGCILLKKTYGEQTNHSNTGSVEALLPMTALFFLFINVKCQTALKKAKVGWRYSVRGNKNLLEKSKKAYQLVKDITSEKRGRSTIIQKKSTMRAMVTINVCSALSTKEDLQLLLREEVEIAVAAPK